MAVFADPPARPVALRRRGGTLVEAVLFIAVAMGLILGGLYFFEQARYAQQAATTVRLFNALVTEMRDANMRTHTVVRWEDQLDEDGNPLWTRDPAWLEVGRYLVAGGGVPSGNVGADGLIRDQQNRYILTSVGTVELDPTGVTFGPGYIVGIEGQLTVAECVRLVSVDARGTGAAGHGIRNVYLYNGGDSGFEDHSAAPPFPPHVASTQCRRVFGETTADHGLIALNYAP